MSYDIYAIGIDEMNWINRANKLIIEYNGTENVLHFRSGRRPEEFKILYTIPLKDVKVSEMGGKGINRGEERILLNLNDNNERYITKSKQIILSMKEGSLNLLKTHLKLFRNAPCKVVLFANPAEYHGGHKLYLAGGVFGKFESGQMTLTETHLLITKYNRDPSKRIEIIIPLNSIMTEGWNVLSEARRKEISGVGGAVDNIGLGGAFIHESGKAHRLIIPYTDENGIAQQPIFGVSSMGGKAIRQWATELYKLIVTLKIRPLEVKDENVFQQSNLTGTTLGSPLYKLINDPVKTQSNNSAPKSRGPIAIPSEPG